MFRDITAALAACAIPFAALGGDADFIVKFATSQSDLGIYSAGNSDISNDRPDGACGVGFGDVPGADDPPSLGDIYASTSPNGLGITAPFDDFNFTLLRVFFGNFGGNCGPTRVLEHFNPNPMGFFNGETALWVEASDFLWIDDNGIAIEEDDGPSTPGIDALDADDFVYELEQVWYYLIELDLVDIAQAAEIVEALTTRIDRRATEMETAEPLMRETVAAAQAAVQRCGRMTELARRLQDDSPALIREASRGIAKETCKAAGQIVSQAALAAHVNASLER